MNAILVLRSVNKSYTADLHQNFNKIYVKSLDPASFVLYFSNKQILTVVFLKTLISETPTF